MLSSTIRLGRLTRLGGQATVCVGRGSFRLVTLRSPFKYRAASAAHHRRQRRRSGSAISFRFTLCSLLQHQQPHAADGRDDDLRWAVLFMSTYAALVLITVSGSQRATDDRRLYASGALLLEYLCCARPLSIGQSQRAIDDGDDALRQAPFF